MNAVITEDEILDILRPAADITNSKFRFNFYGEIRCGLRSKIPVCCILFYLLLWKPLFLFIHFDIVKRFIVWYPPRTYYNYNHVPCLICL